MLLLMMTLGAAVAGDDAAADEGTLAGGSLSVTEDLEVRWWRIPGEVPGAVACQARCGPFDADHVLDYVEQVNRLNLLYATSRLQVGAQVDQVMLLGNSYFLDGLRVYERDLVGPGLVSVHPNFYANLEKVFASGRSGRVRWTAGDGYVSFGRGLALNIVRNTDVDVDTSILGAQVRAGFGDWDVQAVTGLTNAQQVQQDNPNVDLEPDRRHMVSGLRLDRYGLGPVNLGAQAVAYAFAREAALGGGFSRYGGPLDATVVGASAEASGLLGMDWFVEGDWYRYTTIELGAEPAAAEGAPEPLHGRAVYASLAAYPGPAVVLVELKEYRDVEQLNLLTIQENFEVASGPTLEYERVITEDGSAAVNSNDITGARVRLDLPVGQATPYVAVGAFRDRETGGLHFNQVPETIVHPVAGVDLLTEDFNLLMNLGYRVDRRDDAAAGSDRLQHVDFTFEFPLGPLHGELIGDVKAFQWGVNVPQQADFLEGTLALGLGFHELTAVAYTDYTDNPLIASTGNLTDSLYAAGELIWKPSSSTTLKLFYGAYKAGIRCAGGQCRSLPGFDGARLTVISSF